MPRKFKVPTPGGTGPEGKTVPPDAGPEAGAPGGEGGSATGQSSGESAASGDRSRSATDWVEFAVFQVIETGDQVELIESGGGRLVRCDKEYMRKRVKPEPGQLEIVGVKRGYFSIG
jgi:hypothetical protein